MSYTDIFDSANENHNPDFENSVEICMSGNDFRTQLDALSCYLDANYVITMIQPVNNDHDYGQDSYVKYLLEKAA